MNASSAECESRHERNRLQRAASAAMMLALLAGCATSGSSKDPIEGFNRTTFAINELMDAAVLRPVAVSYDYVLPSPVKKGVTNFFGNISDVFIGVNNVLQGKVTNGVSDFARVLVNSTVGILGLIDVASDMGMEKHDEDFGQTFGRWGADSGAYVFLPLFGPRTVRDSVGLALDVATDPIANYNNVPVRNSLGFLRVVDDRANLLAADKLVEAAALDKYSYIRDGYLQRRRNLIYDGSPPRQREE